MGKPYSMDLRERVVAAVNLGGLSCHRAAAQLGVGVNTAILRVRRFREIGSVAPGQMGGHKPKKISGKHRDWLLERTKARDFTLTCYVKLPREPSRQSGRQSASR
jgi:putative transposase